MRLTGGGGVLQMRVLRVLGHLWGILRVTAQVLISRMPSSTLIPFLGGGLGSLLNPFKPKKGHPFQA